MDKIEIILETRQPELNVDLGGGTELSASIDNIIKVAGIRDVQVDGRSVVDKPTRIANVELGDGLEFTNHALNVKGGAPRSIEVEVDVHGQGSLTSEQLELLLRNGQNAISYNGVLYYPATQDDGTIIYNAVKADVPNNQIVVNTETGNIILKNHIAPVIQEHINDNVRHITTQERTTWNNKVSVTAVPDPDATVAGQDFMLVFATS